jgi:hypothetical protein
MSANGIDHYVRGTAMTADELKGRLGWLGLRLGFGSGALGGAASGFLALLLWGLTVIVFKIVADEPLGASDPVTPRQALLNAVFNAIFLGVLLGGIVGAAGGAVIGPLIPRRRDRRPRLGVWVGTILVAALGAVSVQAGWAAQLVSLIEGGAAGAVGGRAADTLFGRWYSRFE